MNSSLAFSVALSITKAVAMDCEMVGVGEDGRDSIVARVSIVNSFGVCIYDKFVLPTETVTDYRTRFSGIRPEDLQEGTATCVGVCIPFSCATGKAVPFKQVQKEVADILKGRVLVGHAVHNDLQVDSATPQSRILMAKMCFRC